MARRKYYRNLEEISGIDAYALWYRNQDKMILVDDDQFIEVAYNEDDFTPVSYNCRNLKKERRSE